MKRTDYIHWDEYFMGIAELTAKRSKDPSTQVGAVIVNNENRVVGIGYNGFPNGISDDVLPWGKGNEDPLLNKYLFVCHSEMNAIMNSVASLKGNRMYVTLHPCVECMKLIIQGGIKTVIFRDYPTNRCSPEHLASVHLAKLARIELIQYE